MNTLYFKYALEVEKTRSITQAAENLYMAQPNLSKAIRELESMLGITIFERNTAKGVIPTEEGQLFLRMAADVVSEIKKMEQIKSHHTENTIKICIPKSFSFTEAVMKFLAQNKDLTLETYILEASAAEALTHINRSEYDIAIIRVAERDRPNFEIYAKSNKLDITKIWDFRAKAVVAAGSHYSRFQVIPEKNIEQMTLLCDNENDPPYRLAVPDERFMTKKAYISDLSVRLDMLRSSERYWMEDSPITKEYRKIKGIAEVNTEYAAIYSDYIVTRNGYTPSLADKIFVDEVYSVKNTVDFVEKVDYQS